MATASEPTAAEPRGWIGRSVRRNEDPRFLTGRGQYVDDLVLPGMLHAAMLRSPYAHALVKSIDYSRALAMPGVHGVLTGADAAAALEPEKGSSYPRGGSWYYMAVDRARFAGEIVAVVAAEDRYLAEDALDGITVEYEPLPVVADPERATDPDQPVLHPDAPGGNEALLRVWNFGDVDAAFAAADVVVSDRLVSHRHSATPIEGLAAIASYDPVSEQTMLWCNLGNLDRYTAAVRALKLTHADVRLIVPDVGGHFGVKAWVHQRAVLLALLSRRLGRPIKWTEDRLEHLTASHHGTPRIAYVDLAAQRDGTLLAIKMRLIDDQGAYVCLNEPFGATLAMSDAVGPYRIQHVRVESHCVLTNKCPVASVRGYGRVQYFFGLERMVDRVAREIGMDPAALRAKNFIPADAYPYRTPSGALYDSGNAPALLEKTRALLDYDALRREQAAARAQGRLIGIGLCAATEHSGPKTLGAARDFGLDAKGNPVDIATIRLGPDGRLSVQIPTVAQGQGHETTIAQIVADRLGVDPAAVRVTVQLDSATMAYTPMSGTYASRFSTTGAPAVYGAAEKLRGQLAILAGRLLEADATDLEFTDGEVRVRGVPERSVRLTELAARGHAAPESFGLGSDLELQATYSWTSPSPDPTANTTAVILHGAAVEVDPDSGAVKILKYVATEDCGRLVNPMIVDGLTMGGVIHGVGWALTEEIVYDDAGQLLTSTFMDYLMPHFSDTPPLAIGHVESPTPWTPLGAKGMGESATIPPPACLANAVEDAIWHLGGRISDSHLAPAVVWQALERGRQGAD